MLHVRCTYFFCFISSLHQLPSHSIPSRRIAYLLILCNNPAGIASHRSALHLVFLTAQVVYVTCVYCSTFVLQSYGVGELRSCSTLQWRRQSNPTTQSAVMIP
ncbi:hypothetical protein EJ06DRAFT_419821 [Trichodelitschia bisporula]|uniref:Uncharacterized protein n=1 Tax=Trichodelitschia bisporula TaxID=703511 RepID=A0A6G1HWR1_9PEZI|nr:hypothetical protein EJ06DRAFT_419821 [Trichodelitschia bisporula]